jgi:hypothetical protein
MRMLCPRGNFARYFPAVHLQDFSPIYEWVSQEVYSLGGLKAKYCLHI